MQILRQTVLVGFSLLLSHLRKPRASPLAARGFNNALSVSALPDSHMSCRCNNWDDY